MPTDTDRQEYDPGDTQGHCRASEHVHAERSTQVTDAETDRAIVAEADRAIVVETDRATVAEADPTIKYAAEQRETQTPEHTAKQVKVRTFGQGCKRVVVATHNAHKVAEIRAIFSSVDHQACQCEEHSDTAIQLVSCNNPFSNWEFVSLDELGIFEEPVEDADSFIGNARIKAQSAHEKTGLAALADDSGLVVDALGGAPGVFSSRYAGTGSDDTANNAKLLGEMEGLSGADRAAHFVCALVFIDTDGTETVSEGVFDGRIGLHPRGENGFGYDPLFYLEESGFERSVAELRADEKNRISHRALALKNLRLSLKGKAEAIQSASKDSPHKHQIVAFDFDGTLIDVSSPVRLIARLGRDKIMSKRAALKTLAWGIRYKMGMELDQTIPRRYVFTSFKNYPASKANDIMRSVYRTELHKHLRPEAIAALKAHQAEGREVIIVSASFDPIISELCRDLGVKDYICTQMEIVDGSYTGETAAPPPESEQKLLQFVAWADEKYGPENWELTHAYGDHYSDVPLMEIAFHPVAVDPDHRLRGIARERGWEIHEWPLP